MSDFPPDPDDYGAGSIRVLPFPESIRVRPEMYVGDVRDGSGLHYMMNFVVEDAIVRLPAHVIVAVREDKSIVVTDDGAAFPFAGPFRGNLCGEGDPQVPGSVAEAVQTAATILMTHATGSLPIVNALSARFDLRLWRDGDEHIIRFEEGNLVAPLTRLGPAPIVGGAPRRGTEVTFLASRDIFDSIAWDRRVIAARLRELAELHPDVRLTLA